MSIPISPSPFSFLSLFQSLSHILPSQIYTQSDNLELVQNIKIWSNHFHTSIKTSPNFHTHNTPIINSLHLSDSQSTCCSRPIANFCLKPIISSPLHSHSEMSHATLVLSVRELSLYLQSTDIETVLFGIGKINQQLLALFLHSFYNQQQYEHIAAKTTLVLCHY